MDGLVKKELRGILTERLTVTPPEFGLIFFLKDS